MDHCVDQRRIHRPLYVLIKTKLTASNKPRFNVSLRSREEGRILYRYELVYSIFLDCVIVSMSLSLSHIASTNNNTTTLRHGHVAVSTPKGPDSISHTVISSNGLELYTVTTGREGAIVEHTCTCPHFCTSKNLCKHIYAVRLCVGLATACEDGRANAEKRKCVFRGPPRRYRPQKQRKKTQGNSI